jgi:hypothetical protein
VKRSIRSMLADWIPAAVMALVFALALNACATLVVRVISGIDG